MSNRSRSRETPDATLRLTTSESSLASEPTAHPSYMDEDIQPVTLSNGATLTAEAENESVITVRLLRDEHATGEAIIPYPGHGLAGGHFIVSPSERFAVLSMFSGQSEEGYELFRIDDSVSRVSGLPYQVGEVASFCFSGDESLLVMALPSRCSEWWIPWEEGEAEPDGAGRQVFPFGEIRIEQIVTRASSVHELHVSVPDDWQPSRQEYDPDLNPHLTAHSLALSMPWGVVQLPLPLPPVITLAVDR